MKMHKVTRPSGRPLMVNSDMLPHIAGLGWSLADDVGEERTVLEQARLDYEELFGKPPHHKAGIEKILADIEEKLASGDS